jgi:hypothetical protein
MANETATLYLATKLSSGKWTFKPLPRNPSDLQEADFTDKWIFDLFSDEAPPGPKPCTALAQLVTDE